MHPSESIEQVKFAVVSQSDLTAGGINVVAGVAGKKIRVLAYLVVANGAETFKWRSGTTDLMGYMTLVAGKPNVGIYSSRGHFETVAGEPLNARAQSAAQSSGFVVYQEV